MAATGSVLRSVLAAVTDALKGNLTLLGMLASPPIYSARPDPTAAYPFLVFSNIDENDLKFFDNLWKVPRLTLNLWTSNEVPAEPSSKIIGFQEALAIWEQVELTLNNKVLPVTGHEMVLRGSCVLVNMRSDPSGNLVHGIIDYRDATLRAT